MRRAPCRASSSSACPRPRTSSSSCDFGFLLLPPSSTLSIGVPFPDDEPPSSPSVFSGFGYPERYAAFSDHRVPQHLAISRPTHRRGTPPTGRDPTVRSAFLRLPLARTPVPGYSGTIRREH